MAVYINIGQADKSIRIHYAALRRITVKGFCSTVNDSQVRSALAECGTFSVSGVQNTFTDTKACPVLPQEAHPVSMKSMCLLKT